MRDESTRTPRGQGPTGGRETLDQKGVTFLETPGDERRAYKIMEFCRAYGLSSVALHELWRQGRGPRVIPLTHSPQGRCIIPVDEAERWWREQTQEHRNSPKAGSQAA